VRASRYGPEQKRNPSFVEPPRPDNCSSSSPTSVQFSISSSPSSTRATRRPALSQVQRPPATATPTNPDQ
jgi:hypothetical protein